MMNYPCIKRRALMAGAMLVSTSMALAQPAAGSAPQDEEVIELSPFEVIASSDVGYQATQTLGGTRIRTDLRDVGSAISVATREFMRDIGATDNQSLLQYMTGAEVGGTRGNFGGIGDAAVLDDAGARLRPNNNTRIRGLDSATNARDFYVTDIPWDSYNTDRIDIQRGANSILFGNGSGAGIINGSITGASVAANSATVEARYGSFGSYRGSLNINRVLLDDELGVRFAALYDKTLYRQEPAFNEDRRLYGAIRWEPKFLKRGSARTTFRVNYENGDINANRPRTTPPQDAITPYFITSPIEMHSPTPINAAGQTLLGTIQPMKTRAGYDPFVTGVANGAGADALRAANPTRRDIGARVAGNPNSEPWLYAGAGPGVSGDWYGGPGAIYADPTSGDMSYYLFPGTATLFNAINSSGARDGNINGLRGPNIASIVRFDQYVTPAAFTYQASGVYRSKYISDPTIFDFYNNLLDGPNKREWSKFDAVNVAIDQTFWNDRAGIQAAYDFQDYSDGRQDMLGSTATLTLDVYTHLPVAAWNPTTNLFEPLPNPNFGRPFVASNSSTTRNEITRNTWRITPFVDLDFADLSKTDNLLTKILGRHTITGLLEGTKTTQGNLSWVRYSLDDATTAAIMNPTTQVNSSDRRISTVSYLGPSMIGASTASGANISNIQALQVPRTGSAWYFNSTWAPSDPSHQPNTPWTHGSPGTVGLSPSQNGASAANQVQAESPGNYRGWRSQNVVNVWNADLGNIDDLYTNGSKRKDTSRSWALVDQWALLGRNVVFTAGVRKDEIKAYAPGNYPTKTNAAIDWTKPYNVPATPTSVFKSELLKTYSIVVHMPESWSEKLPFGLRPSIFYNQSDNFRPVSRAGLYGQPLAPPTGETKDYGFMISALDGRVALKVNHYETNSLNATLQTPGLDWRIGDEFINGLRFATNVKNHANGWNFANSADPTDTRVYAYQPATGTAATWTTADWQAAETQAQAIADAWLADLQRPEVQAFMTAWNISPSRVDPITGTASNANNNFPQGFSITGDTKSEGWEYELFLRPTDNWNVAINASKTSAQRLNLAGEIATWIESRNALYEGLAGDVRWWNGNQGNRTSDLQRHRFGRNAWSFYNLYRAQEGNDVPELRPWRFNVVSNYNFREGRLKGAFVGAGYRWEDENTIGYGVSEKTPATSPANPAVGFLDVTKPFKGPSEDHIDLWLGYERKIFRDVNWRIQLNVRNLTESKRLVPINTNPDGSPAAYRIAEGATWQLTNTLRF